MIYDLDAVADLLDLLHVMARVHDGRATLVEPFDAFENRVAALRIHRHRRLVEEDGFGLVHYAACNVQSARQTS